MSTHTYIIQDHTHRMHSLRLPRKTHPISKIIRERSHYNVHVRHLQSQYPNVNHSVNRSRPLGSYNEITRLDSHTRIVYQQSTSSTWSMSLSMSLMLSLVSSSSYLHNMMSWVASPLGALARNMFISRMKPERNIVRDGAWVTLLKTCQWSNQGS